MMKRTSILLLLLALLPVTAMAQSFSALLTGASEVPAADVDGTGLAVMTISGTTINYTVFHQGIAAPTMAHIHRGAAGVNGPIVVDFNVATFTNGVVSGVDQALINEILANPSGFYVNVHNGEFPGGAIRGQLTAASGGGEGLRTTYLPVVGKVTGANNTNFVTDVRVINRSGSTANVTFDYFASSSAGQATPSVTKITTIGPGEQEVIDDLLGTLLGTNGLGALRVTSDQNLIITSRVINDLRASDLGTNGFASSGLALEDAVTSGTLSFLSSSAAFRTNVGYFNPMTTPVTATFVARRTNDGAVLGTATLTIPGQSQVQQGVFGLVSSVPEVDRAQTDFYVTWTSTGPLFVYGSVVDNKTGDSVLVR